MEASDLQEACVQAIRAIEELREKDSQYWSGWTLEATDAAGGVLFTINLDKTSV